MPRKGEKMKSGQAFKMGFNQIRKKLDDATPEEKAELLDYMREIEEALGFQPEPAATETVADVPQVTHFEAPPAESVNGAVEPEPEPRSSPNGKLHDFSKEKERLERRRRVAERQLDRGENTIERNAEVEAFIPRALEIIEEAERIPRITRRYGCTLRGEIVTLDGYRNEQPIKFRDWTYETSNPIEIAFIERRIRETEEAQADPRPENQYLRSSARIYEIRDRVAMVDWHYTSMFRGFKSPEDADMEERMQSQIRASKRMQRLRR